MVCEQGVRTGSGWSVACFVESTFIMISVECLMRVLLEGDDCSNPAATRTLHTAPRVTHTSATLTRERHLILTSNSRFSKTREVTRWTGLISVFSSEVVFDMGGF